MDRRKFLSLLGLGVGGVAVSQAIPFGRVWSFPQKIFVASPTHVRFVRGFDVTRSRMCLRLDVLYGWPMNPCLPSNGIDVAEVISLPSEARIMEAVQFLVRKHNIPQLPYLNCLQRTSKHDPEMRGFLCDESPYNAKGFSTLMSEPEKS
jgi:hypothetical protein